jgi:NAD(P)H-dependent FMN reductase
MESTPKKVSTEIKLLGFAGSLRSGSYNKALLRLALEFLPRGEA